MSSSLLKVLETAKDQAKDALWALSSCLCHQSAKVKINGRTFNIIKVLGEGGFSFVYLAQDEHSGRQFALKKIRCPTGNEGVKEAMREVEAYRRFKHPNIIRILDSAVTQDPSGDGQLVYLFLPLYARGNLQDAINTHVVNGTRFAEREMVRLFGGVCVAVRALHTYRVSGSGAAAKSGPARGKDARGKAKPKEEEDEEDDDDDDARFPQADGDAEGGYSYGGAPAPSGKSRAASKTQGGAPNGGSSVHVPLMAADDGEGEVVFDGDEELHRAEREGGEGGEGEGELVPYAHRDLKPGNVMISDDGRPILMDFGSTVRARVEVRNRFEALEQQDMAAEQSTMAYRAPELFDVKTGTTLDEKVDIWSLGCTLFALAYSHSPFENTQTTEQGGSIAMAVLNARYKQPASAYSQGLQNLIDAMLKVDPKERPDIHQVIKLTDGVLRSLT
ncbi:hypothetical protein PLICRDRAFT_166831 [Plicaturopsis crispa FD-325 SS-3]|uniref:non-specific serine/threonine protein kinase n=1 Tax=Plicaturopsis crispa FD-325 SS-3 TaxID=944288 RepID=A0A0C9SS25_PLICR|nr:hypothetical protein PLICRDRAFT_166831 [Plicaturopsis crispa FD-325 SS-3]